MSSFFGRRPRLAWVVRLLLDPVAQPEGYSAQAAQQAAARAGSYVPAVAEAEPGDYPDVVVILNESLYEPALVTDPLTGRAGQHRVCAGAGCGRRHQPQRV